MQIVATSPLPEDSFRDVTKPLRGMGEVGCHCREINRAAPPIGQSSGGLSEISVSNVGERVRLPSPVHF